MNSLLLLVFIVTSSTVLATGSRCECQVEQESVLNRETPQTNERTIEHEKALKENKHNNNPHSECHISGTAKLMPLSMDMTSADLPPRPVQLHEPLRSHSGEETTPLFPDSGIEALTSDEFRLFLKAFGERIRRQGELSQSEKSRLLQLPMPMVLFALNTSMPRKPFLKYLDAVRNRGVSNEYETWRYLLFQQKMDSTMRTVYEKLIQAASNINPEQVDLSAIGSGTSTTGSSDIPSIPGSLLLCFPRADEADAPPYGADVDIIGAGMNVNPECDCDCSCEECSCEGLLEGLFEGCSFICQKCCGFCEEF